jgi:hypothetical protein
MPEDNLSPRREEIRDGVEAKFALLKHRLLLQRLDATPEREAHALIIHQADEAGLMAWLSSYPLLAFPCLFEEKAAAITEEVRIDGRRYWDGMAPEIAHAA